MKVFTPKYDVEAFSNLAETSATEVSVHGVEHGHFCLYSQSIVGVRGSHYSKDLVWSRCTVDMVVEEEQAKSGP